MRTEIGTFEGPGLIDIVNSDVSHELAAGSVNAVKELERPLIGELVFG